MRLKQQGRDTVTELHGVYRGVVADVDDPEQGGRVKVNVPAVMGDDAIWAPVLSHGHRVFVPDPGAEIVVAFEAGDPTMPIVIGTLPAGPAPPR